MTDDVNLPDGGDDDLRSTLAAAFEADAAPEPDAAPEIPAEETDPHEETAAEKAERVRDERGRFAKAEEAAKAAETPAETQAASEAPEGQEAAVRPPPGWSVAAKAEFDKLPPSVREAVAKREAEVNQGFAKLAEYKAIDPYVKLARDSGTTLDKALENYVGIERTLQRNPVEGFARIAQNIGVHPVQMAQQVLAAYGQRPGNQQPAQQQRAPIDPSMQQWLQSQLMPLQKTVSQLTAERQALTQSQVNSAIDRFFADPANKFADNLIEDMVPLINQRKASNPGEDYMETLKWAYDRAAWGHPETRAALLNEQAQARAAKASQTANQARAAAKSITGSPTTTAVVAETPADDLRSELVRQFNAAGGRI